MEMEKCRQASLLMWILVAGLLSQNFIIPVMSRTFEDQKNYYSPDPHSRSPPRGSHGSPPHGTTPSHGSGGSYGTPPSHTTPSTPSGGSCGTPPPNCGTPSHGSYNPTPSTPSGGNCGTPPSVPTPSTPSTPSNPPSGGGSPPTPVIVTPPTTPISPGTPYVPTPPSIPDPNSPFSCNYWRTHPGIVWGLVGWWGTLGNAFGVTSLPGIGASMSLQQALSNTRTDGYGTLYREGTASLLNSLVNNRFHFTTTQVRESFIAALGSNKAAAAQGHLFKQANENQLKPRT